LEGSGGVGWVAMGWEIQRGWQVPLIEMPSNSSLGQRGMTKLQPHTHACSSLHFGPPTCLYIRDDFDFWFGDDQPTSGKTYKTKETKARKTNGKGKKEMSGSAIKIKPA